MGRYRSRRPFNDRIVYPLLKRIGISVLTNLADSADNWIGVAKEIRVHGIPMNQVQLEAIDVFQEWLRSVQIGSKKLENSPSWCWKESKVEWEGWIKLSKFWHNLFEAEETPDDLSAKWPEGSYALTWSA
ncbi:hypothetical protein R1flu_021228 [Riccia fluitans]|uniref:Uncharacterized protein n=1 Tax=Riccia fluitans TaxID=41844 RepID=A0ABD1ZNR7_9MARC